MDARKLNIARLQKLIANEKIRFNESLEKNDSYLYRSDILERLKLLKLELVGLHIPPTNTNINPVI